MQLDLGALVVVGAISNTQNNDDLTVTDNLGNTYIVAVQGLPQDFGVSGHAGDAQIAYTIVTHAGMATITNTSSVVKVLGIIAAEYTIPTGMVLSQVGWRIGDIDPTVFGGNPAIDVATGTEPVNYSNSLLITLARNGGFGLNYVSEDGDNQRGWIPHLDSEAGGGGGALFDAILGVPGIRNSRVLIQPNFALAPDASRAGITNSLIAVFSNALPRPGGLIQQAAIRPGKSGVLGVYNGQTTMTVSLPYMPAIGSLLLVGCASGYTGGVDPVPTFVVTDAYGNIYASLGANSDGTRQEADEIFSTTVTSVPTTGVFTVTITMVPFPTGTGATAAKSMTVAEVALPNIGTPVVLVFSGNTPIAGGLMRLFTNSHATSGSTLIAGFGAARYGSGTQIPVPWDPSGGFTVDTEWGGWQVDVNALSQTVRLGTGDWFHKTVSDSAAHDAETIGLFTGATGIMAVMVPFTSNPVLTCPLQITGQVGVPYSSFVVATFGVPPYSNYHLILGTMLPPGLTLNSATGEISGIPTTPGTYTFSIEVTDSLGHTGVASNCPITILPVGTAGIRRGMSILTAKQWATIREKHLRSHMPTDVYFDHDFENAGFHVWPVPIGTPDIEFYYWGILDQFAALDTQVQFPPGYYDALVYNLALMLTSAYRRPVTPNLLASAQQKKEAVQTMNAQILAGSYHESRTLLGPSIGDLKPQAIEPDPNQPPWAGSAPIIVKP